MTRYHYCGPMQTIALRGAAGAEPVDTDFCPCAPVELDPEHRVTIALAAAGYLTPAPETGTALVLAEQGVTPADAFIPSATE